MSDIFNADASSVCLSKLNDLITATTTNYMHCKQQQILHKQKQKRWPPLLPNCMLLLLFQILLYDIFDADASSVYLSKLNDLITADLISNNKKIYAL